jgi:uncharacterized protein involved in outer membrane biogenesis
MRRRRVLLVLVVTGGLAVLAAGGGLLALRYVLDLPRVQDLLRSEASRLLERPVRFERVSLSYWPLPAISVRRLTVANPPGFGADPLLVVDEARVRVRLLPLLVGRLQFGEVILERPRVVLEQRADGSWNLPAPAGARPTPAAPLVLVSRIRLRDGHLRLQVLGEPGRPVATHLVDRIDVTLDDLGWSAPIRFRVSARLPGGGLAVTIDGTAGPLAQAGGDLAALPARLDVRLTAEELPPPTVTAFALSGKGEGRLQIEGLLGGLKGGGRVSLARLSVTHHPPNCPPGPARTLVLEGLELPVAVDGPQLAIRPFVVRLAGGVVRGDAELSWRAGTPGVRLAGVSVKGVNAEPVLVGHFCQPYAVSGKLDATGAIAFTGLGDELLRSARGTWEIRVGAGRLVGPAVLGLVAGAVRVGTALYAVTTLDAPRGMFASPTEFQSLSAGGSVGGGQLRVREMLMDARELRVSGDGTYGLVDTRMDFNIRVLTGRHTFAVRVGGTGRDPTYGGTSGRTVRDVTDTLAPLLDRLRKGWRSAPAPAPEAPPR